MNVKSYKDLVVWQRAVELSVSIYAITEKFPGAERYGLTSQMRRAAISIPSNIAEGWRRKGRKEFHHFASISYGSGSELETQIIISKQLPFGANLDYTRIDKLLDEVMRMLNTILARA
jgi:four helix bundle protein